MLGIIDWGIGGISIYKLIKERIGDIGIVYFSDTGVTPYGRMSRPELVARLKYVISFLKAQGVTHLVIGCNAASTVIDLIDKQGLLIEGVIDCAIDAAIKAKPTRLGVIGGRRTILSGVYRRAFADRGVRIEQRIAQPLSGLIESGDVSSEKVHEEAKRILAPLKNCSHILLACTHYPAITALLTEYVSGNTKFIDPAAGVVKKISTWHLPDSDADEFLTSGEAPAMMKAAGSAFGVTLHPVKKVSP
jgi:glutamate racemase